MQRTNTPAALSLSYLSGLVGVKVAGLERLGGGRNSKAYRLTAEDGTSYALKQYCGATASGWDRLSVEFSSLTFLHGKGVTCVPRPIASDPARGCAIYEYVAGAPMNSLGATESDIDQACRFLLSLNDLKSQEGASELHPAAEACFSLQAVVRNIDQRLAKLQVPDGATAHHPALRDFLGGELVPAFQEITSWCSDRLAEKGESADAELDHRDWTLSPSDFGFHNCVRQAGGRLVFLDFEYFGWDDPAKMASDFLLHPAMDLGLPLKRRFLRNLLRDLDSEGRLARRIVTVYPLFGLKWCLILLNEFLPENLLRREFAGGSGRGRGDRQAEQLAKAGRMLQTVRRNYEHFPYWGDPDAAAVS